MIVVAIIAYAYAVIVVVCLFKCLQALVQFCKSMRAIEAMHQQPSRDEWDEGPPTGVREKKPCSTPPTSNTAA